MVSDSVHLVALAYRIWQVTSKSAQYRSGGRLSPILRIIVESGALYSITVTAALVLFLLHSNGVYIVLDMVSSRLSSCPLPPSKQYCDPDLAHHLHRV